MKRFPSAHNFIKDNDTENVNRPFPHYVPVSNHKEMRTSLGWTFSYKSLYFVHPPSLDLVPLFTGNEGRSIIFVVWTITVLTST